MTTKQRYIGVFLFLVAVPAAFLWKINIFGAIALAALCLLYLMFIVQKVRRRCMSCGQIILVNPYSYVVIRIRGVPCPRCGVTIKNTHRV